jgi:hypothetical protein
MLHENRGEKHYRIFNFFLQAFHTMDRHERTHKQGQSARTLKNNEIVTSHTSCKPSSLLSLTITELHRNRNCDSCGTYTPPQTQQLRYSPHKTTTGRSQKLHNNVVTEHLHHELVQQRAYKRAKLQVRWKGTMEQGGKSQQA